MIVDCENGYGDAINVVRMTKEYEAIGIAGISIDDDIFPKRCSFYKNVKRKLISAREQANKIRAIINTRKSKEFFVIARTNTLIANYEMDKVLKRANLYAKAGADAILVHSKSKTAKEIYEFSRKWQNKKIPLVL